jgi:ferritin-like metal-binding protein YciE
MPIKTAHDLFVDQLRDLYHAEKQLVRALPKMAKAASSDQLKQAFQTHLEETKGQVERLEQVFEELSARTRGKRCEAMEGLIEEAKEIMEEVEAPEVRDAGLIVAAQKVEHYEIASYGSAHAFAEGMGQDKVAKLLAETLEEEKKTDELLNKLAISEVNKRALEAAQ